MENKYTDINAAVIDSWVSQGWEWGQPISHEVYQRAKSGDWSVVLTPMKPVPKEWFGSLAGARVLGLASGGGQQMPIFSALGADCTVLDYSLSQLESERMVSQREGYPIEIVRADMTQPLPFPDGTFDLIFHPVSNCYVEDVYPIWRECFRVLKDGGRLLAGFDNGINFVFDLDEKTFKYKLPYNPLTDEKLMEEAMQQDDGVQFSHTIEEQVGGQLKAGFLLKDIYQDTDASGNLHDFNVPLYYATLAVKEGTAESHK